MERRQNLLIELGLVVLPGVLLLLIAMPLLPSTLHWHLLDLTIYTRASEQVLHGHIPYKDFSLEYPPLALLPFVIPCILAFNMPLSVEAYGGMFGFVNVLYSIGVALILAVMARGPQVAARRWMLVSYALFVAITAPLLPWRYDMFPAFLTACALLAVLRERPMLAGVLLGLGVAAKLYPVVIIAAVAVFYLARDDRRALAWLLVGSAGVVALVMLPFLVLAPQQAFSFLTYHEQRGLQLESVAGGLAALTGVLRWTNEQLAFNFGAMHLQSAFATAVLGWLLPLFIGSLLLMLWLWSRQFQHECQQTGRVRFDRLVACVVSVLLIFMATNKVLSPQYMIWLLPFVPLLNARQRVLFAVMFGMHHRAVSLLVRTIASVRPHAGVAAQHTQPASDCIHSVVATRWSLRCSGPPCALGHRAFRDGITMDGNVAPPVLALRAPYDFARSIRFWRISTGELCEQWADGVYRRVMVLDNEPAIMALHNVGTIEQPAIAVEVDARPASPRELHMLEPTIRHLLGDDLDLQAFYAAVTHDPVFAPVTQRLYGLKPTRSPLWETLCYVIIGQQISVQFAYKLKERLVSRYGESFEAGGRLLYHFPSPERLAAVDPAELVPMQFSRSKASFIIGLAQQIITGTLDLDRLASMPTAEAIAYLTQFRGIGAWSAEFTLMRGLGRADAIPANDAGVRNGIAGLYGERLAEEALRVFAERWSLWSGVAALYLLGWLREQQKM